MKANNMQTKSKYTTDSFRQIKDAETGEVSVKRWVEERQVAVTLNTYEDTTGVFWKGARIA
jgi:hypothetical protein